MASIIETLLSNSPAITSFVHTYNVANNAPCATKLVEDAFPNLDVKKILNLMKENGDVVGTRGRNGGLLSKDFNEIYGDIKAEKKAEKVAQVKAAKAATKVETVKPSKQTAVTAKTFIPVGDATKTDVCGNPLASDATPVCATAAVGFVNEIREIISKHKKTVAAPVAAPAVETVTDDDSEDMDVEPLSFDDAAGPSDDDLNEIDDEYSALMNDMNDIVGSNKFSEAE
jgi:hypothetical protein